MDAIFPEITRKLLFRDFATLVQRVQRGDKLNRAGWAMLQGRAKSDMPTSKLKGLRPPAYRARPAAPGFSPVLKSDAASPSVVKILCAP